MAVWLVEAPYWSFDDLDPSPQCRRMLSSPLVVTCSLWDLSSRASWVDGPLSFMNLFFSELASFYLSEISECLLLWWLLMFFLFSCLLTSFSYHEFEKHDCSWVLRQTNAVELFRVGERLFLDWHFQEFELFQIGNMILRIGTVKSLIGLRSSFNRKKTRPIV